MIQTLEKVEKNKKQQLADEEKKEKQKLAQKTVKSSRKRPDVGEKEDFAEFIKKAGEDTSSEDTILGPDSGVREKKLKKRVQFVEDDDRSSVSSFEPHER